MRLDMTEEERQDYIEEAIDVFKNSTGSPVHETSFRICLGKAGMDVDEINHLVRINRP